MKIRLKRQKYPGNRQTQTVCKSQIIILGFIIIDSWGRFRQLHCLTHTFVTHTRTYTLVERQVDTDKKVNKEDDVSPGRPLTSVLLCGHSFGFLTRSGSNRSPTHMSSSASTWEILCDTEACDNSELEPCSWEESVLGVWTHNDHAVLVCFDLELGWHVLSFSQLFLCLS